MVANSSLGSGLLNGVKSASDLVGGASNLASLIGAGLGATSSGGQQTSAWQIDPRMAAYLYGSGVGDTSSLLGAAQKQFLSNPSGINPTMQAGLDMQKAALTDPAYAQSYQQMRNVGTGLLSNPIASNPYQATAQAGGVGGLLGGSPGARAQSLIAKGRGLI